MNSREKDAVIGQKNKRKPERFYFISIRYVIFEMNNLLIIKLR
jgi:hypothetical protein